MSTVQNFRIKGPLVEQEINFGTEVYIVLSLLKLKF